MPLPRRPLALVAVWSVGALVATGTGVLAVRQVADRVSESPPPPLSAAGVETALAQATHTPGATPSADPTEVPGATPAPASTTSVPSAAATRAPAPPAPPAPAPVARSFRTAGGDVGVSCDQGVPRLVYATPAQGWAVDDRREAEGRVEVRFRSEDDEVRVRAVCGADGPQAEVDDSSGPG